MNELRQGLFSTETPCRNDRMAHKGYIRFVVITTLACVSLIAINSFESLTIERSRLFLSQADCSSYPPEVLRRSVHLGGGIGDGDEVIVVGAGKDIVASDRTTTDQHDQPKKKASPHDDAREKFEKSKDDKKSEAEADIEDNKDTKEDEEDEKDEAANDGGESDKVEDSKENEKIVADPESTEGLPDDEEPSSSQADNKPDEEQKPATQTQTDQTPLPKIAWLMSFPNSGTSYTMTMVARASTRATATNYASEVTSKNGVSLQVDPESPRGPFWAGLNSTVRNPRPLPDKFVMTKTHCGSRCTDCGPDKYIQSAEAYLMWCASGHALLPERVWGTYDMKNVERGIHLLRNPFHNIIARFHLDRRQRAGSKRTDYTKWLEERPNNAVGLRKWCSDMDKADAPMDAKYLSDAPMDLTKVPCHGEFYKYTQWHNLLFESLKLMPKKIPIHTVYYEDYAEDVDKTIKGILDFLDLERTEAVPEFTPKSYDGYFSPSQEERVKDFIQWVSNDQTWTKIQHYFDE